MISSWVWLRDLLYDILRQLLVYQLCKKKKPFILETKENIWGEHSIITYLWSNKTKPDVVMRVLF